MQKWMPSMYACLVAVMCGGKDCIHEMYTRLTGRACLRGNLATVVTSAGALINALQALQVNRVAMITPYKKTLTSVVEATLQAAGLHVVQTHSLEVTDNVQVGRLDPKNLLSIAAHLDLSAADALIISACVQMPSLPVIEEAEQRFGLPVLSAATASAFDVLTSLGIQPNIKNAGELLRPTRIYNAQKKLAYS
jgi:maleate isomerase